MIRIITIYIQCIASIQIPIRIFVEQYKIRTILINSLIIIPDTFLYVNFTCLANSSPKTKVKKNRLEEPFSSFFLIIFCSIVPWTKK